MKSQENFVAEFVFTRSHSSFRLIARRKVKGRVSYFPRRKWNNIIPSLKVTRSINHKLQYYYEIFNSGFVGFRKNPARAAVRSVVTAVLMCFPPISISSLSHSLSVCQSVSGSLVVAAPIADLNAWLIVSAPPPLSWGSPEPVRVLQSYESISWRRHRLAGASSRLSSIETVGVSKNKILIKFDNDHDKVELKRNKKH